MGTWQPAAEHHRATLAAYLRKITAHSDVVAVIVTGSVARGQSRDDSDIDVYVVLDGEAYIRAATEHRISYADKEVATYVGGYVDVKILSLEQLRTAVIRGDEPMRASFEFARVVHSTTDNIEDLVASIPVLPNSEWQRRVEDHLATARLQLHYFLTTGLARSDAFLTAHAAVHGVTAAHRCMLAQHRILFQGPKHLHASIARMPDLPTEYLEVSDALLAAPTEDLKQRFGSLIESQVGHHLKLGTHAQPLHRAQRIRLVA